MLWFSTTSVEIAKNAQEQAMKNSIILTNDNLPEINIDKPKKTIKKFMQPKIAAMIENSSASRPGLSQLQAADIVFEAPAEGGITRFLALYETLPVGYIGPIRSVRDYFLDWTQAFSSILIHRGGSETALAQLYSSSLMDIDEANEDYKERYFYRNPKYDKPHDLFVNIQQVHYDNTVLSPKQKTFQMIDTQVYYPQKTKKIFLNFSYDPYNVVYKYDKKSQTYLRYHGETPHNDTFYKKQISVKNIIVQFTEYYTIDDKLRLSLRTEGKGECIYFINGTSSDNCIWEKDENDMSYTDKSGYPLLFPQGNIWIEVIQKDKVSFQ